MIWAVPQTLKRLLMLKLMGEKTNSSSMRQIVIMGFGGGWGGVDLPTCLQTKLAITGPSFTAPTCTWSFLMMVLRANWVYHRAIT